MNLSSRAHFLDKRDIGSKDSRVQGSKGSRFTVQGSKLKGGALGFDLNLQPHKQGVESSDYTCF